MRDVAVDGRDPLVGQPAHGLEVQLDDDGLELVLAEQPDERPAHRAIADDHDAVAVGLVAEGRVAGRSGGRRGDPAPAGSPMNRRRTASIGRASR